MTPVAASLGEPVALIRSTEVDGALVDVAIEGGRVAAIGPALRPLEDGLEVDGRGGALLPGLHDHHLHLRSLAAELSSVTVGPPAVRTEEDLRGALSAADRTWPSETWIRAVGYHESVAGELDRSRLDAMVPDRPVRVQHRSGALWVLNGPALAAVGEPEHPDGRLFRRDAWLRDRLAHRPLDLTEVGRRLASWGVTAVTDATPFATAEELLPIAEAVRSGALPQRVTVMGAPGLDPAAVPPELVVGPAKLLLPDHVSPSFDEVVADVRAARSFGRAVAVHCVTRAALALTIAALDAAGGAVPGDRIEHGAVVPPDLRAEVARRRLIVVTQPNLVAERGEDYLEVVEPEDLPHLWPCRSLLDAGIVVRGGTDAPFGDADPWALVDAAVQRRTPRGQVVGTGERITSEEALALVQDEPVVRVGSPADLVLLTGSRADLMGDPSGIEVVTTVVGGQVPSRPGAA